MLRVGDIKIHLLSDGDTKLDAGGMFGLVPRALYFRYFEPDDDNLIPSATTCLLVQVNNQNILVDTGIGSKIDEKRRKIWHLERPNGDLIAALGRLGLKPEDIDLVINTHLHSDHCSGNTQFKTDFSGIEPTFPNAEYVVQKREYDDAINANERTSATYLDVNWEVLVENGQMRFLQGDVELAKGVWGVVTPGHTPGHMSVRFESNGEHGLFLCDMASFAVHFERLGWMTAYDVEPLVTLETKRYWQKWALDHNALLIFVHDVSRKVGRLTKDDKGKMTIIPIDEPYS